MAKFFIFGDSFPYGKWDTELNGWASRLRRMLDEKIMSGHGYYETYNFGVPGDFSEGLLKRFESDLRPRFRDGEDIVIIFEIGVNDSQFQRQTGKLRTSKEDFEENLRELIGIAQKYTSKVVVIGLTPINEEQTLTVSWYRDDYYKNKLIFEYNEIIKQVCLQKSVYFIDVFEKLNDKRYFDNLVDGIHPNAKGHEWLFRIVKEFLVEKKLI